MSGFDIPKISGFGSGFKLPQGPASSPEVFKIPDIQPVADDRPQGPSVGGSKPFDGFLADSVQKVSDMQNTTKGMVKSMVMGEDVDLHEVMIAGGKSEVAFNLMLEVRNKLIDAWEKLSRSAG
tara:strand:- start:8231 stop:8599 length:369 start_codon:yes stop_codon:yes gene_type:complete